MISARFDPRRWLAYLLAPLDGPLAMIVLAILGFATVVMVSVVAWSRNRSLSRTE